MVIVRIFSEDTLDGCFILIDVLPLDSFWTWMTSVCYGSSRWRRDRTALLKGRRVTGGSFWFSPKAKLWCGGDEASSEAITLLLSALSFLSFSSRAADLGRGGVDSVAPKGLSPVAFFVVLFLVLFLCLLTSPACCNFANTNMLLPLTPSFDHFNLLWMSAFNKKGLNGYQKKKKKKANVLAEHANWIQWGGLKKGTF